MMRSRLQRAMNRLQRRVMLTGKQARQYVRACPAERRHVFIAGMQRSGTNMLADCLERSYQTDVYHERDPRAFDEYAMRPLSVIRQLAESSRAECFVIKALCELDHLPVMMEAMPPARTVWIVRDFNDVVNSARLSFKSLPGDLQRLSHDPASADWRGRGMSEETFSQLRRLYHPGIDADSAIALFWYLRNVLFFELGLDRDPRVQLVRYEELVSQPEVVFSRLFAFLELHYTPRIASQVFTSSVGKRAAPVIEPDIRVLCETLQGRFAQAMEAAG